MSDLRIHHLDSNHLLVEASRLSRDDANTIVSALNQASSVETVSFEIESIEKGALEFLTHQSQVKNIVFDSCKFDSDLLLAIAKTPQLHSLALTCSDLHDGDLDFLAHLTRLKKLDLDGNWITDKGLEQISRVSGIEELSLAGNAFSDTGLNMIGKMPHLKKLTVPRDVLTPEAFASLNDVSEVVYLDNGGNFIKAKSRQEHHSPVSGIIENHSPDDTRIGVTDVIATSPLIRGR